MKEEEKLEKKLIIAIDEIFTFCAAHNASLTKKQKERFLGVCYAERTLFNMPIQDKIKLSKKINNILKEIKAIRIGEKNQV